MSETLHSDDLMEIEFSDEYNHNNDIPDNFQDCEEDWGDGFSSVLKLGAYKIYGANMGVTIIKRVDDPLNFEYKEIKLSFDSFANLTEEHLNRLWATNNWDNIGLFT